MTKLKSQVTSLSIDHPETYLNREISWIEFNQRVLHEAFDDRTPLLERLKFLAIFSTNLDEYFMVRVSALKEQLEVDINKLSPDGLTASEQLDLIWNRLQPLVARQHQHFSDVLKPLLAMHKIYFLDYIDLNQEQRGYYQTYFEEQIFPVLTPLAIDPSHPFPFISNLSLNLAVVLRDSQSGDIRFARVKAPRILPRFLRLPEALYFQPEHPVVWMGVPLEQIIAHNLSLLFPGMDIQEYYPFRITRDADAELQEEEADDLLIATQEMLRQRRIGGSVVRLEIQTHMPQDVREKLIRGLNLSNQDVYEVDGLLGLSDVMSLLDLPVPELKDPPWMPVTSAPFPQLEDLDDDPNASESGEEFFSVIRKQDLLVHHPYHSFATTVQRFIIQSARDPDVLAIKMTLYRTSGDSPLVNALIQAAANGKQVAVLVELKARFDEENNIQWAQKLEKAGVHVVYGLVGLKTHTKTVLVVRRESDRIRRYLHIGTGNYNPKTARLYTDLGLLSCRDDLGADLSDLFNFLTGYSRQQSYRKLLIAPVNLRQRMMELILREAEQVRSGGMGRIVAKMNSLTDTKIIAALYKAAQAGVKIDLIIRGMCCLRPGVEGFSENIRVLSIVGRFLEHARIFYFHNGGQEEVYIGSADWMSRNLDRRVEAIVPIDDPRISKDLQEILGIMLADHRQAWELRADGTYVQRQPDPQTSDLGSQTAFMEMARQDAISYLH
jgi:polyphosphate kinase